MNNTGQNKRYRIGVICHSPSIQMSAQYDALAELADYEFHLLFRISSLGNPAWQPKFPEKVKYDLLSKSRFFKIPQSKYIPLIIRNFFNGNILPMLNKYNFDAMIMHGIYDSSAVWQAVNWCIKNNKPYLLRCDANVDKEKNPVLRIVRKFLIGKKISQAAGILHIGTQNKKYYELFGARQKQFHLAPWEIDYDDLENSRSELLKKRNTIREQFGVKNEVVILSLGRILKLKGFDNIVPVIRRLKNEGLPIRLIIAGDGPYLSELKTKYNIDDCSYITFTGNLGRSEVCKWLTAADIFVLCSFSEAWGLVINEAALFGLPFVVSSAVGASNDIVYHEVNGFIYPPGDTAKLSNYLKKLIIDENLRTHMGIESFNIISNWRKNASALQGYQKALDQILNISSMF